jgi:glycosyltransferase involved in cell wall biosynthesis
MGRRSELFADARHIAPDLAGQVRPHTEWDAVAQPGDVAVLHYSIASPAFAWIAERAGRTAIHYHNITPARLLWRDAPGIARECADGRRMLGDLAGEVAAAAADSAFNAAELDELGFPDPHVLGVLRRPRPGRVRTRARDGRTRLLFVGRGIPNKAQHDLILALAALRQTGVDAELQLIGSWGGAEPYQRRCRRLAAALHVEDAVMIRGGISDDELSQAYADADAFVCLSDHEGFCVPLVEAMEANLPIVAYDAGAVAETVGEAALLLDEKPPSLVAEAVVETLANPALAARMAAGRAERLGAFALPRLEERLRAFIGGLL